MRWQAILRRVNFAVKTQSPKKAKRLRSGKPAAGAMRNPQQPQDLCTSCIHQTLVRLVPKWPQNAVVHYAFLGHTFPGFRSRKAAKSAPQTRIL